MSYMTSINSTDVGASYKKESTPIGMYNFGLAYLHCADRLIIDSDRKNSDRLHISFDHPIRHLYAHALEIFLKACLVKQGKSQNYVRNKIRHNLKKAYDSLDPIWHVTFDQDLQFRSMVEIIGNMHSERLYSYLENGSFLEIERSYLYRLFRRFDLSRADILRLFA